MGLDQHRAQVTADWLDTASGEDRRARVAPAARAGERARRGWGWGAQERGGAGAAVHLAEPAETAARRGNKKRAKNDRADARHLRELVMVGRESWIPPDHILDLRARVRLRHSLVAQAASGSSASRRCSITTASRSGAT